MRKLSTLATLALLAGCRLAPPNVRPDAPTPQSYSPDYAGDVTIGARATEIAWRDFFRDPRLDSLIATALTNNRDLAIAVGRIDEARGLYRIQNADRYPTLVAGADVTDVDFSAGGTAGKLKISPSSLSFGVVHGSQASAPKTIKLKNVGRVGLLVTVGTATAPFARLSAGGTSFLPPHATRTVTLQLNAGSAGTFQGLLSLTSTDPRHAAVSVRLSAKRR